MEGIKWKRSGTYFLQEKPLNCGSLKSLGLGFAEGFASFESEPLLELSGMEPLNSASIITLAYEKQHA